MRFRQIIATVAVAAMSMSFIPKIGGNDAVLASVAKNESNTCFGTSKITAPVAPKNIASYWSGSYVYYGNNGGTPIKFRVLAPNTTEFGVSSMFLDSDTILFSKTFGNNNRWSTSELKQYLNGTFLTGGSFTSQEQGAIAKSYKNGHSLVEGVGAGQVTNWTKNVFRSYVALEGEKIFVLDAEDLSNIQYGYDNSDEECNTRIKNSADTYWWIRSANANDWSRASGIWYDGNLFANYSVPETNIGVAPALNVDLSKILFSTAIDGTMGKVGASYKLTILDNNLSVKVNSSYLNGTKLSCAATGNADQVSLLITDKAWNASGSNIKFYGAFNGSFDLSSIGLNAADWGSKYHVYLIAEDINSDKATDYASTPVELAVPSKTFNVTFNSNGKGTAPATQTVVYGNKATKPSDPTASGYSFGGWYTDSACTKAYDFASTVTTDITLYAKWVEVKQTGGGFEGFVERLYVVALGRASEKDGKDYWCKLVGNGTLTGADCARFFLTSQEFKERGLSDEEFLKVLYSTFFDRNAADDPDGFNFWMNSLKSVGKDTVVEGFINSPEWCNICADYGVKSGAPTAKATNASKNATAFATRLYTECLGREPEEGGLKYWSLGLTNLELTGSQAAHEFFYCQEFNDHGFDNKELITRMYKTFMGRNPDDEGLNYWLNNMNNGMTKDQVFNSFVQSQEFTEICASYAITR